MTTWVAVSETMLAGLPVGSPRPLTGERLCPVMVTWSGGRFRGEREAGDGWGWQASSISLAGRPAPLLTCTFLERTTGFEPATLALAR